MVNRRKLSAINHHAKALTPPAAARMEGIEEEVHRASLSLVSLIIHCWPAQQLDPLIPTLTCKGNNNSKSLVILNPLSSPSLHTHMYIHTYLVLLVLWAHQYIQYTVYVYYLTETIQCHTPFVSLYNPTDGGHFSFNARTNKM